VTFGPTTNATRITLGRLLACPVFIVLFYASMPEHASSSSIAEVVSGLDPGPLIAGLAVLVLQEISDVVDGMLARATGVVTDLGKLLDPLADILGHMGTFLCLLWIGLVPLWLLIVIYYREAMVGTLRIIAAKRGIVVAARTSGKLKSIALGGSGFLLMLGLAVTHYHPGFPIETIASVLSAVLGMVVLFSGIDYLLAIRRTIREADGKA